MFRKHDVSDGCCRSKFPTILSLLEIDNANVANCLIDQRKVEKVIIMNHEEDARNLLSATRTVPRNLIYALTTASNQYYPAPNYRTYTVTRNPKDLGKLKTSVSEHLERLKNELEEYRVDVETVSTFILLPTRGLSQAVCNYFLWRLRISEVVTTLI